MKWRCAGPLVDENPTLPVPFPDVNISLPREKTFGYRNGLEKGTMVSFY
jgi:hypothetical protein